MDTNGDGVIMHTEFTEALEAAAEASTASLNQSPPKERRSAYVKEFVIIFSVAKYLHLRIEKLHLAET
jgi:hypothetical protein